MKKTNQLLTTLFIVTAAIFSWMNGKADSGDHHTIFFSEDGVFFDNELLREYDLIWNADPSGTYNEIKNAPAVHFSGNGPTNENAPWIGHDLIFYPKANAEDFHMVLYDGAQKWAQNYTSSQFSHLHFGLLPVLGNNVPTEMTHTAEEAFSNPKLHITRPGTYELSGQWQGQIWVDLGENASKDPNAVVTLVLNGLDIRCTAAPAIVFYQTYECDQQQKSFDPSDNEADLSGAGSRVFLAPNSINTVHGANVPMLLTAKYKKSATEDNPVQKKLYKMDGAIYSYTSFVLESDPQNPGRLDVVSEFEGIGGELHIGINGGIYNIKAMDDGINASKDHVSVIKITDADLTIQGGLGFEGDGIDSNGAILIHNGTIFTAGNPEKDPGIDADSGVFVFGGTLLAFGEPSDWPVIFTGQELDQALLQGHFNTQGNLSDGLRVTNENDQDVLSLSRERYPNGLPFSGFLITAPELSADKKYTVRSGDQAILP